MSAKDFGEKPRGKTARCAIYPARTKTSLNFSPTGKLVEDFSSPSLHRYSRLIRAMFTLSFELNVTQ
jgi:hypothetical protein